MSLAERLGYGPQDRLLILNCDDVGSSHAANQACLEAMRSGAATSGTLMVPCPWAREAARQWISLNGFTPAVEDIVVTSGAQHALLAVVSSILEPGDIVVSDRLTYYGLKALAAMFRFHIIGVGMDEEGLSASELEAVCARETVRAVFTTPSMHNPSVVTMSERRRRELHAFRLRWLR